VWAAAGVRCGGEFLELLTLWLWQLKRGEDYGSETQAEQIQRGAATNL
jgi:hypothetical protein